jgi:hypothetical protein
MYLLGYHNVEYKYFQKYYIIDANQLNIWGEKFLEVFIRLMPIIACIAAVIIFSMQYRHTRENDWLYFIASFCFYGLGEITTNLFGNSIIFPLDIIFYILFYLTIIFYFRSKQKSLIKLLIRLILKKNCLVDWINFLVMLNIKK